MHTQVRTYSMSMMVGVIITAALLVACNHRVEQAQQDSASPITETQSTQDTQALSVIEAASALHNRPEQNTEDLQALQVESQVLKQYAGRYDSAR